MADWNTPSLTSTYTSVLDTFKSRDVDSAVMFSPTYATALTNVPTGTVRWNPTGKIWEIYSGTAWGALETLYNINVDKLDGQDGSYYRDWANLLNVPATFAPSAHTHDDRYYTETEADGRYGNNLFVSGNNIQLRTVGGTALTTLTVPYATAAGNASTVGGFSVGQNLLTTSSPSFTGGTITGTFTAETLLRTGKAAQAISVAEFYDNAGTTWRSLQYNSGVAERWQVEHTDGTFKNLYHEGHVPDWTEVSGKPATFAPSAHGHAFDQTTKMQVHRAATATLDTLTGLQGEVACDTTTGRLRVYNGSAAGGAVHALLSDIPAAVSLTAYARLDTAQTFTQGQTLPFLRLSDVGDAALASAGHAFQIGPTAGGNLIIDANEVMARNNGAAALLALNADGGNITLGATTSTVTVAGTLTVTTGLNLPANSVLTADINTSAVTTTKIADGAVTAAKLASGAIPAGWVPLGAASPSAGTSISFTGLDLTPYTMLYFAVQGADPSPNDNSQSISLAGITVTAGSTASQWAIGFVQLATGRTTSSAAGTGGIGTLRNNSTTVTFAASGNSLSGGLFVLYGVR
jgi:hypothetical protein